MKRLCFPTLALLFLSLTAGCSSSSTSASTSGSSSGARSEKSPDDQVKDLLAELKALPEKERRDKGPIIGAQIMGLRDQVSESTRKQIDFLMNALVTVETGSNTATATRADSGRTVNRATAAADPSPENETPRPVGPEVLPPPRQEK